MNEKLVEIAKTYVGKHESEIMKRFPTNEECAATMSCICDDFDKRIPTSVSCTTLSGNASGSIVGLWQKSELMKEIPKEEMDNGDFVFFDWPNEPIHGDSDHIGMLVDYDGDYSTGFYILEGNSGSSPDRVAINYHQDFSNIRTVFRYVGDNNSSEPEAVPEQETETVPESDSDELVCLHVQKLQKGSSGPDVESLQAILRAKGYSVGTSGIDGEFGKDTENAVRNFQSEHKLTVDGVAGEKTLSEIWNRK